MNETRKNYDNRIKNGDFDKYLHGYGIDIGGGDDCLQLPLSIGGGVLLWDIQDGDAQYMHKLSDNKFDFVYSSHCLEHMRNLTVAFTNWVRICKPGGYLYICVPHEIYYEKGVWPSKNNGDHKHSFTAYEPGSLPANVVVKDFLAKFKDWVDVIDIRENLMNYHFDWDKEIDQTAIADEKICAQIDFIVQKKDMELSKQWRRNNNWNYYKDYWSYIMPMRLNSQVKKMFPKPIKKIIKQVRG